MNKDEMGDYLKAQEQLEAGRKADPNKPLMARLDGRAFHTFTKGLQRPYDTRLTNLMIATTEYLVKHTHAKVGYTQSDEITLSWWNDPENLESLYMFDGKFQKLTSVLAGMASGFFCQKLSEYLPEKAGTVQIFDCRVWNVESKNDVYLNYLWRQDDCIKNSISMAAQAHFSAKQLHGVGSQMKKSMLRGLDKPWEDEPAFFKTGTFLQRVVKQVLINEESYVLIPEKHRNGKLGDTVERTVVEDIKLGYIKNDLKALDIFK